MFFKIAFALSIIVSLCFSLEVRAASCCGGSSAAPSVLVGDYAQQMSLAVSRSTVIGDAPAEGIPVFRRPDQRTDSTTSTLTGATLITDRAQVSGAIPWTTQKNASELGDVRVGLNYEVLPEWSYSEWIPNGFVYLQYSAPTGRSVYELPSGSTRVSTGSGFHKTSLGSLWLKTRGNWDFLALPEIHTGLTRTFQPEGTDPLRVSPGYGVSTALGMGFSPSRSNWRFGTRLQPNWNFGRTIESSSGTTHSSAEKYWDTSFEISYLLNSHWGITSSYTDQTLIGPANNTTLSRTVSLSLQNKFFR